MIARFTLVALVAIASGGCVEMSYLLGPEPPSSPVFDPDAVVPDDAGDNTDDGTGDDNGDTTDDPELDVDPAVFGGVGDIPAIQQREVVTTDSGLSYIDLEVGQSDTPLPTSTVTVNYIGWLTDGTEFDSGEGTQFGLSNVIAGWTEGVGAMRIGGRRRLLIPPNLAYGEKGTSSIPGNSTLVFDVDLIDIQN